MMRTASSTNGDAAVETLPAPLSGLVERVIRGTRLWPSEKRDLRAELESHFREGLIELIDEGLEFERAVTILGEEFGDPDLAARLIRRGKKRGRPMIWKVFVHAVLVAAFGAGTTGGYLGWLYASKPNPTVDYVEIINEPVEAVPYEQRAWPALQQVFLDFQPMPEELRDVWQDNYQQLRPGGEHWPLVAGWLEANRPLIPAATAGAHQSVWGFVYGSPESRAYMIERERRRGNEDIEHLTQPRDPLEPALLSVLLPCLSDVRDIGKLLAMDARDHAAGGDFAAAWNSLDTAHRLGLLVFNAQTLIEQLVGVSMANLAATEMRGLLRDFGDRLDSETFALIGRSNLMSLSPGAIQPNISGERLMVMDTVQYLFTDDGAGNGHLIPEQYARVLGFAEDSSELVPELFGADAGLIAASAVHADRRETVATYERIWAKTGAYLSLPLNDPRRARYREPILELQSDPMQKRRFGLLTLMLPDLGRADQLIREADMNQAATQAVVALLRYRAEQGHFPKSLGQLVPAYLPELPEDVYSGIPLRYFVDRSGWMTLYSFGRNLADDGASRAEVEDGTADILYWPAPRE